MSATKITVDFEKESNIPVKYLEYIRDRWDMVLSVDVIPALYRSMFNTITTLLKYQRTKSAPHIGFKLLNEEGEFVFGAVLDFHAPEGDEDDTGNWTLSFTFNEEDMAALDAVYDNLNDMFFAVAQQEIRSSMYGNFQSNIAATKVYVGMIEVIKNQLNALADANVGAEIELSMPGIFMACVGWEDGDKVLSIIPGHNIKQQIKDDKGLSK